jgi:SulP family sulfate permease
VDPWRPALALLTSRFSSTGRASTHVVPGSLVAIVVDDRSRPDLRAPVETIAMRFGAVPHSLAAPALPMVPWPRCASSSSRRSRSRCSRPSSRCCRRSSPTAWSARATLEHGARRAGHREHRLADLRRHSRHGRDRAHRDEHQERRAHAVAGMVHAVVLLLDRLFLAPLAERIPICTLAGILVVVAYNMSEWRLFAHSVSAARAATSRSCS